MAPARSLIWLPAMSSSTPSGTTEVGDKQRRWFGITCLPRWGKLQASTITRADVKALMARIAAPVSANQTLAAVSAIFSWAVREEIVPANPVVGETEGTGFVFAGPHGGFPGICHQPPRMVACRRARDRAPQVVRPHRLNPEPA